MEVKIIRSGRRLRTVGARLIKDVLVVNAPITLPEERLQKIIDNFKLKFERRKLKEGLDKTQDLNVIASRINTEYFANRLKLNSIQYVTGQSSKFGCCNYKTADIRISHRVGMMPHWVRDYVIIHEMAHLIEPNHSKAFWNIVFRYKLSERARGYLIAVGLDEDIEGSVKYK